MYHLTYQLPLENSKQYSLSFDTSKKAFANARELSQTGFTVKLIDPYGRELFPTSVSLRKWATSKDPLFLLASNQCSLLENFNHA